MNGQQIGIAGVGLIGGSIGLRAAAFGARVTGFDKDPSATSRALERGAIDAVAADIAELACGSDVLVIALPVDAVGPALDGLAGLAGLAGPAGPRLIMDVASVKAPLQRYASRLPLYLGTHPMAGREIGGIEAADAELFAGATWAHLPHADRALVERARAFIAQMGARPFEIEAARHDAIVALTSHLPQALSVALASELAEAIRVDPGVTELCGPGMISMLRLARSPAAMWSPIVSANAAPLAFHLRSIARALAAAADGLDQGDSGPLMSYFENARTVTGALEERFPVRTRS